MNLRQKLSGAILAGSICLGGVSLQAANFVHYLPAITSGNWNSAGVRGSTTDGTPTDYQIGFSTQLPNEQIAFYEFDLDPVKGQTVSACVFSILGSTDYNINSYWGNPDNLDGPNNTNSMHVQFKVGIRPQGTDTLSEILTGNNNVTTWVDADDANRNQDLGYIWITNGRHANTVFDTDHYNNSRLQTEVNAGGDWVFWAADDFDTNLNGDLPVENYIWGTTQFNNQLILEVTTTTGPASGTAPAHVADGIANGTYKIINQNNGLALDVVGGSTKNGTLVDTWPYSGHTNQQWTLTSLGNDCYEIAGVASGTALDVQGAVTTPGTPIDIYTYSAQNNQQWLLEPGVDAGTYTIESTVSGNQGDFLDCTTQGQTCTIQANDGNPDQEWTISAP
jgi:hypothetical protein